jgi:predicted TIM-barrel fold metal-dependent hydrolase
MQRPGNKKIIDVHVHALSLDKAGTGCFISKSMMNSLAFKIMRCFFDIKNGDSTKVMDEKISRSTKSLLGSLHDIDYLVFLAFDGVYDKNGELDMQNTHFYVTNDYVRDLSKKHEKVLYGASVNPNRKDSLDELERVIKDGAALIKWLPNSHGIDPGDKRYTDFYRMLAKNRMPLLVHTGREYAINVISQRYGDLKRLELPLSKGVTVIAAHGGGLSVESFMGGYDRLIGFLKTYPNFYIDTAALFLINKRRYLYKLAENKEIHHKIVYGSDWPIPSNPLFFVKNTPMLDVVKSLSYNNSIQRNYALIKKLNFDDKIFYTGYDIIKKDCKFESI